MNITLIRCAAYDGPRETNVTGTYPPLGLAYLGAALREAGHEVTLLDAEALRLSSAALLDAVPADAGLIGFTATTLLWPTVRRVAEQLRALRPTARLVIGGPHVTAFPKDTLDASVFDIGVLGDGEQTLVRIADCLEKNDPLTDLPGCVIRTPNGVQANLSIPWIQDLDALPLPALDLLPMSAYKCVAVKDPFVTMISSRGCPYRCTFCAQIYSGNRLRTRSPKSIVDEMERAVRDYHAQEIVLFDETFGVRKQDAVTVCSMINERGLTFRWNARTRIDVIDEALLTAMRSAGCYALHLGIEAGTQRILDAMDKKITVAQVRDVVALGRRLGFRLHGYFMIGWPGETRQEIETTLTLSRELDLDWASYTIVIPNPRTPLYDRAQEEGVVKDDFWRNYTFGKHTGSIPFFTSEACPEDYLVAAKRRAYQRFYLRPKILWRNLVFFLTSGGLRRVLYAFSLWLKEGAR